jgi:hypothetical protein
MNSSKLGSFGLRVIGGVLVALLMQAQASAQVDPPGRVARMSYASGSVSFAPAGSGQWAELQINRPLVTGDSIWVSDNGRAELHIGSSALRFNERTSVSLLTLSDETVQLKMTQGTMVVRVRNLSDQESFEIDTPNLAFSLQEAGEYRININEDNSTTVMVRRGTAIAYGDRDSVTIREAEQVNFSGTNLSHDAINRMPPYDNFDRWVNDRDRAEDTSVSARYVSRDMIGYQQLDNYGTWENNPQYGAIWIPRDTEIGWAPYRSGNWTWIAPWGWTWVDRAPWGFAPYHYGRWAHIGPRWAWVPGHHARNEVAVYAPALVAFVGGSGVSASLSISFGNVARPAVAWFPLAPGEAYRPGYYSSTRYVNNINRNVIVNNNTVINNRTVYINQRDSRWVTAVPATSFAKGEFVGPTYKTIKPGQLTNLQVGVGTGAPAIRPENTSMFGTARRVTTPENDRLRNRPVVATIRPAELPTVQVGPIDRSNRAHDDGRGRNIVQSPTLATPAIPAESNVLLHNASRPNRADRNDGNDRSDRADRGLRQSSRFNGESPTAPDQGVNNVIAPQPALPARPDQQIVPATRMAPVDSGNLEDGRRPSSRYRVDERGMAPREQNRVQPEPPALPARPVQPVVPVMRAAPVESDNIENARRPSNRNRVDDRGIESRGEPRAHFEEPASQANLPNPPRNELRRDRSNNNGFNMQPADGGFSAPQQRSVERAVATPREMSRPVEQQPAMPQPMTAQPVQRVERQPSVEPRREAPGNAAKPEREKGRERNHDKERDNDNR